jgi:peptide/nickel transport system ATP-binding protein
VVAAEHLPTSERPLLEARGLSRHFQVGTTFGLRRETLRAVDDVSFALRPGVVTALVGQSGSGKSTIARLLLRLQDPTSGSILLGDEDVARIRGRRHIRRYRSQVQIIFQDPFASLNAVKRVEHHIARPLRIHRIVPRDQVRSRVLELLTSVGLVPAEKIATKYPHELSGGQQQRVAIARALAVEPSVLVADEPVSMLDVSIRLGILNLILELKARRELAILYITHDLASARYVADEILVLFAGQVVERGATDDVLQTPLHPYTKLLLSAVPNPASGLHHERLPERRSTTNGALPDECCRFVGRCPVAFETCRAVAPQLLEPQRAHGVRCHLFDPSITERKRDDEQRRF